MGREKGLLLNKSKNVDLDGQFDPANQQSTIITPKEYPHTL